MTALSTVLDRARDAYLAGDAASARRLLEAQSGFDLESAAFLTLCWVRQVLSDRPHGAYVDVPILQAALSEPFASPRIEGERRFALGWLSWLASEPAAAEEHLHRAVDALVAEKAAAEAAYWLGRVRLSLGRPEALSEFERTMRLLPASPQLTCWFVDLLGRSGQGERAEGVWKTVRGNRRVRDCDEAAMLEARPFLRLGELAAAERLLQETQPRGGVVQVERLLLLAWIAASRNQRSQAEELLHQAEGGPFPSVALDRWRRLFTMRFEPSEAERPWPMEEGAGRAWIPGQRARAEGRHEEAVVSLREAATLRPLEPFARYALACLHEEDHAAILNGQPGLFVAVRCRAQQAVQQFCRRQISPAELLETLHQSEAAGYRLPGADHIRRLALTLKQKNPHAEDLRRLVAGVPTATPSGRNLLRAAVEVALHGLTPAEAICLLKEWKTQGLFQEDVELRTLIARQILRLTLGGASLNSESTRLIEELPEEDSLRTLVQELGGMPRPSSGTRISAPSEPSPLVRVWQAAVRLREGSEESLDLLGPTLPPDLSLSVRGLLHALRTYAAARRGDATTLVNLLGDLSVWQGFTPAPPRFVLQSLSRVMANPAILARCRQSLEHWLALWDREALGTDGRTLAAVAGIVPLQAHADKPPTDVPAGAWLRHQAALALLRTDAPEALAWIRRAMELERETAQPCSPLSGTQTSVPPLADLQRLARSQALAAIVRYAPDQPTPTADALAGMLACLESLPEGVELLATAEADGLDAARAALERLADQETLPLVLVHHLAIVFHRAASFLDTQDRPAEAEVAWRRAGRCWQRKLGAEATSDHPLMAHLLAHHRRVLAAVLARGDVAAARRRWETIRLLGDQACVRLREELTNDTLSAARDAARGGEIAEGWRADHEQGLACLVRVLCLETDNVRLLTALVEACQEYFLDCYNNEDVQRLKQAVDRYTPYALRLARLLEGKPAELLIRSALAEFTKFRGFVASDPARRAALFREALKFDPTNENVRELLAEVEQPREVSR